MLSAFPEIELPNICKFELKPDLYILPDLFGLRESGAQTFKMRVGVLLCYNLQNNFRIKNITQTPVINLALQRILIQKLTFRVQLVKQQLLTVEIDIYGRLYLS